MQSWSNGCCLIFQPREQQQARRPLVACTPCDRPDYALHPRPPRRDSAAAFSRVYSVEMFFKLAEVRAPLQSAVVARFGEFQHISPGHSKACALRMAAVFLASQVVAGLGAGLLLSYRIGFTVDSVLVLM